MIRKIIILILSLVFILIIGFIIFFGYQFYSDYKRPKTPTELKEEKYYATHHKEVNEKFIVDAVKYNIIGFNYSPRKGIVFLDVDVIIENKSNVVKNFPVSFFILKEGAFKIYYPIMESNNIILENKIQTLKLQYILPERKFPYLKYDLYIISKTDTAQNKMIRLYKSYRAEG